MFHTRSRQQSRIIVSFSWCDSFSFLFFYVLIFSFPFSGVCLYGIAELLVPCFEKVEKEVNQVNPAKRRRK